MSSSALAADLLEPVVPVEPVVVPEAFSWTGGYVGLNAGWAFEAEGDDDDGDLVLGPTRGRLGRALRALPVRGRNFARGGVAGNLDDFEMDGPFVGAQAGFNYQTGMFVIGVEGDIQWANIENDDDNDTNLATLNPFSGIIPATTRGFRRACRNVVLFPCQIQAGRNVQVTGGDESVDWFGTARLRAGVALDRTLLYATGGVAFGDTGFDDITITGADFTRVTRRPLPGSFRAAERVAIQFNDDDESEWGWVLGGGVEHAFTDNVSVKAEYQYINLGGGLFGDDGDDVIHGQGLRTLAVRQRGIFLGPDFNLRGRFNAQIEDPEVDFHTLRVGVNVLF